MTCDQCCIFRLRFELSKVEAKVVFEAGNLGEIMYEANMHVSKDYFMP